MAKIGLFLATVSLVFFYCAPIAKEGSFQAPNISVSNSIVAKKGEGPSDNNGDKEEDNGDTAGGSTTNGGTTDGSTDGSTTDGGTTDGGTTDGSTTDGGTTDGGNTDGGTTTGETDTPHGPEFIGKEFPETGPAPITQGL